MKELTDEYFCPKWFFCNTHKFFCGCENCKKLMELGFNEKESKILTFALETAHRSGGDAGGPYSDFDTEALPDALEAMEVMSKSLNK